MTFEEWWVQLHPAEVDELKPVFEDCWRLSQREALLEAVQLCENERLFESEECESDRAYNMALKHAVYAINNMVKELEKD